MPALAAAERKFALFYQTKANLKRRQVALLADAGVRWIQPGIESLDDRVLPLLAKGASAAINVQLLKWCRNYGVWLLWNMLFGAPGEEDSWYEDTAAWLPLIYHLQPPSSGELAAIQYNRFSPYFERASEFGLDLVPFWAYRHTYPHDAKRRAQQAYFFHDARDVAQSIRYQSRAGVRMVNECLREWTELFIDAEDGPVRTMRADAPVLIAEPAGDGIIIHDTRPCAVASSHELTAIESRVYRACDAAITPEGLANLLAERGSALPAGKVDRILRSLKERKLVHGFGGRVLALAVDDPPAAYPDPYDFPAGLLLREPLAAAPSTIPDHASVWDLPLSVVFRQVNDSPSHERSVTK
jgi:magnesium-protoporphyrin IX monomethyl ester (oxidative) cyclase